MLAETLHFGNGVLHHQTTLIIDLSFLALQFTRSWGSAIQNQNSVGPAKFWSVYGQLFPFLSCLSPSLPFLSVFLSLHLHSSLHLFPLFSVLSSLFHYCLYIFLFYTFFFSPLSFTSSAPSLAVALPSLWRSLPHFFFLSPMFYLSDFLSSISLIFFLLCGG